MGGTKHTRIALLFVVTVAVLGVLVRVFLPRHETPPPPATGPYDAWIACRDAVRNGLKAPSTADFPAYSAEYVHPDGDGYAVSAYVDADNSFGAHVRTRFTCTVRRTGDRLTVAGVS